MEYYAKLERGALAGVSASVLEALARALQLDDAERTHLFDLASAADGTSALARPRRRSTARWTPRPSLQWALDAITASPAIVRNGRMDLLATNTLGWAMHSSLYESASAVPAYRSGAVGAAGSASAPPNFARLHPSWTEDSRRFYPDWDTAAAVCVQILRTEAGRDPHDKAMHDLVGELSTRSEAFRRLWSSHDVRLHGAGTKTFHRTVVGDLELAYESAEVVAEPGPDPDAVRRRPRQPHGAGAEAPLLLGGDRGAAARRRSARDPDRPLERPGMITPTTSSRPPAGGAAPPAPSKRFPVAALSVLALTGFLLISTETMPAGVLPQTAAGLGTSEALVGQLVSAYALGTILVTVPAVALTRRWPRKRLLLVGLAVFLVANTATALSSDVALSLVARFVAGGCSGLLWAMMAGYAIRIAPPATAGRALSLIAVGAPVGIAFGTPLGAWLGAAFDWRWAFGGLSVLALLVLVLVAALVPRAAGQDAAAAHRPARQVLRIPAVTLVLAAIVAWMLGNSTAYTYIAPYVRAGGSGVSLGPLLLTFGLASIAGIALTAALVDSRPRALSLGCAGAFTLAGAALVLLPTSALALYGAVAVWGVASEGPHRSCSVR